MSISRAKWLNSMERYIYLRLSGVTASSGYGRRNCWRLFVRTNCCSCRLRNKLCIPVADTMTVSQLPVTWGTTEPQIPMHSNPFHLPRADSNIRNTRGTTETCRLLALSYASLSTSDDYPVFLYSCLCPQQKYI